MPSGADLEYAKMLAEAGVSLDQAAGYDGARLQQIISSRSNVDVPYSDSYRIDRVNSQAEQKIRLGAGKALVEYTDSVELTKDWTDLSGWQTSNAQVLGNKMFAVNANNPGGGLKSFPVASGEFAHFSTLLYWKSGGSAPLYFGIDFGAADHVPVASSPDGIFIGFTTGGTIAVFKGSSVGAIGLSPIFNLGVNPVADTTYYASIDILEDYISLSLVDISNPDNISYAYITRSTIVPAGKAINNVSCFIQDARGTAGHGFGPVTCIKGKQPTRTKVFGSQRVDGSAKRFVVSASGLGGDPWRIQFPSNYDPRIPSPVVIWAHQSLTGDADDPWTEARMKPLTKALTDAGYIFASCGDIDSWGNSTGIAAYSSLYKYIRDNYNTGSLFLIGASMGAIVCLNMISRSDDLPTPSAFVSIGGVCNLGDLWAQSAYDDGIANAYGISSPDAPDSEYLSKTAGFNPIDKEGWEFKGVPMKFYTSVGDTAVPKSTGCDVLAPKVANYSPEATVVVKSGGHLDVSQYPPTEIVNFFNLYR